MFSTLGTISSLTTVHCVLKRPHNHGLIVKFIVLSTLPPSPASLIIEHWNGFLKNVLSGISALPPLPFPVTHMRITQFLHQIGLPSKKNHLLSAASCVMIRTRGVESEKDLFWKTGTPPWPFPGLMLLSFSWWQPQPQIQLEHSPGGSLAKSGREDSNFCLIQQLDSMAGLAWC